MPEPDIATIGKCVGAKCGQRIDKGRAPLYGLCDAERVTRFKVSIVVTGLECGEKLLGVRLYLSFKHCKSLGAKRYLQM